MQHQAVSINSELTKFAYQEYLNSMTSSELAYWLVNSFSPERYRDPRDVVGFACRLIFFKSNRPELIREFVARLWGMFGLEPDHAPYMDGATILHFKKAN